ncbi:hypothetical protein [Streptomyces microflavus]
MSTERGKRHSCRSQRSRSCGPYTGAGVGIARITDCHQDHDGAPLCSLRAHRGAWHLELADVHKLPLTVPARGQLGPSKPTSDLPGQVFEQLPGFRP